MKHKFFALIAAVLLLSVASFSQSVSNAQSASSPYAIHSQQQLSATETPSALSPYTSAASNSAVIGNQPVSYSPYTSAASSSGPARSLYGLQGLAR